MTTLDWTVILVYAASMLAVGWYYGRRNVTADDYLLGGRSMGSLSVGLSLFATMLSTITYIAWPGEMIKHGPMMLATLAGLPLVYILAGWFIIPRIMKFKITSANEMLEARLGVGVRILGAILFLTMRLAWMAVIIFATTDKILMPLIGLDRSLTPLVCAVLGLITVIYTSQGGLRAVVVTDVAQGLILFGGAILTLVLISYQLGGVSTWWPTNWPDHWPEPVWGFSSTARVTFLGAALAQFTWWICTAGSDQMAIQRYLATRDAESARGVLLTSLVGNAVAYLLLGAVGLALLSFFGSQPELLAGRPDLLGDADRLFPRFIEIGMPAGVTGLVIAGLLAAAMSSLSSGLSATCSIIIVDFIGRFLPDWYGATEIRHLRLSRTVSLLVGLTVTGLAAGVGMFQGNLLEVSYKVVNLLTAPLFGLFFMAMFVRWATGPGTIIGAIFGVMVAVTVSYWKELTGSNGISFLWAMPLAFLAEVTVGSLASLLPLSRSRHL